MKEIIRRWFENPNQISMEDAIAIIREYCKIFGNREVTDDDLQKLFFIHQHITPIQFEKLVKYICLHHKYKFRELWSQPDQRGNRTLICYYFDE